MKKLIITLCILSPMIIGCGNKLSRSEAEAQIKERFQLPIKETRTLTVADGTLQRGNTELELRKFRNKGLLTYQYENVGMSISVGGGSGRPNGIRAYLTEEGQKYAASEIRNSGYGSNEKVMDVIIATLEFGEITGILEENENTANVQYTLVRKEITPFGEVYNIQETTVNKNVTFSKFDDGWRIQ